MSVLCCEGGEDGEGETRVLMTYNDSALSPTSIPMPRDIANPIPLPPNAWPNRDLRVQLDTHLEVTLKDRLRNRKRTRRGRVTLEATDHSIMVPLLGRFSRRDGGCAVNGFVQDWVIRVVLLHGTQVVGTLEEVLALTGGVFGSYRLAVDALCRETLLR